MIIRFATMIKGFMRYFCGAILLLSALLACPPTLAAQHKGWEPVKNERSDAKVVARDADIEIKVANGLLIINSSHPAQVKIFTILGRLVSNESIPAGKSQMIMPAHGVYIVKVGDMTCKVAV